MKADSKNLTCLSFTSGEGNRTGGSGVVISKAKSGERNREALALHGKDSHQGAGWPQSSGAGLRGDG